MKALVRRDQFGFFFTLLDVTDDFTTGCNNNKLNSVA